MIGFHGGMNGFIWWHGLNFFFFHLSYVFMICGPIYAIMARGGNAFSREKQQVGDEEAPKVNENGEAIAPVP